MMRLIAGCLVVAVLLNGWWWRDTPITPDARLALVGTVLLTTLALLLIVVLAICGWWWWIGRIFQRDV